MSHELFAAVLRKSSVAALTGLVPFSMNTCTVFECPEV